MGQHRTNAGDEFVNGVKAVETEWAAVLGKTLCPIFYRKMPQRLAKRLEQCRLSNKRITTTGTVLNMKYTFITITTCLNIAVRKSCNVNFFDRMNFGARLH